MVNIGYKSVLPVCSTYYIEGDKGEIKVVTLFYFSAIDLTWCRKQCKYYCKYYLLYSLITVLVSSGVIESVFSRIIS